MANKAQTERAIPAERLPCHSFVYNTIRSTCNRVRHISVRYALHKARHAPVANCDNDMRKAQSMDMSSIPVLHAIDFRTHKLDLSGVQHKNVGLIYARSSWTPTNGWCKENSLSRESRTEFVKRIFKLLEKYFVFFGLRAVASSSMYRLPPFGSFDTTFIAITHDALGLVLVITQRSIEWWHWLLLRSADFIDGAALLAQIDSSYNTRVLFCCEAPQFIWLMTRILLWEIVHLFGYVTVCICRCHGGLSTTAVVLVSHWNQSVPLTVRRCSHLRLSSILCLGEVIQRKYFRSESLIPASIVGIIATLTT